MYITKVWVGKQFVVDVEKAYEPINDLENTGEINQVLNVFKDENTARCIYDDKMTKSTVK